jgi:hypothetical protein
VRGRCWLRDQQRLHRVARAVALGLGVVGDADGLVLVGAVVDVDVADAVEVLDDGDRASREMRSISPLPPRGTITSTYSFIRDEFADGGAVGVSITCTASGRPAARRPSCTHARRAPGCVDRFRAAAQDRGVAGLQAQAAASAVTLGATRR